MGDKRIAAHGLLFLGSTIKMITRESNAQQGVTMDKEVKDRVEEIQQRIVQLRDSL